MNISTGFITKMTKSKRVGLILGGFTALFCLMIFALVFLWSKIEDARSTARFMHKSGQLNYIHTHAFSYPIVIEANSNEETLEQKRLSSLKPNMFHPQKMKTISWREWMLEFKFGYEESEGDDAQAYEKEAMSLYCASGHPKKGQTNFVFVIGDRTIHNYELDRAEKVWDKSFDKIWCMEYPTDEIPWNSLQDISVADAVGLWRQVRKANNRKREDIAYITLKGEHGRLSSFDTEEAFKNRLLLTDDEIERYNSSLTKSEE